MLERKFNICSFAFVNSTFELKLTELEVVLFSVKVWPSNKSVISLLDLDTERPSTVKTAFAAATLNLTGVLEELAPEVLNSVSVSGLANEKEFAVPVRTLLLKQDHHYRLYQPNLLSRQRYCL